MKTRSESLNEMITLCQEHEFVADVPKEYIGYILIAMRDYAGQEVVKHLEIASKAATLTAERNKQIITTKNLYWIANDGDHISFNKESITGIEIKLT